MKKQKNPATRRGTFLSTRKKEGKLVFKAEVYPDGSGRCTLLEGREVVFDANDGKIKDWVKEVRSQQRIYSVLEFFLEELTGEFAKLKIAKPLKPKG